MSDSVTNGSRKGRPRGARGWRASENGQAHKRYKGPFPALETKAGDQDNDGDTDADDVALYCAGVTPGGK